ncbi:MAG: c-type cytochrome [bacterium]
MKKLTKIVLISLGLAYGASASAASTSSNVVWDSATRNIIKNADPAAGEKLAEACAACHGKDAATKLRPNFPRLAGQPARYIYKQMMDYKDAKRGHGIMQSFAVSLKPEQIADIAVWYESLGLPPAGSAPQSEIAAKLVNKGDGTRLLPPCAVCHGRNGEGAVVDVPALAGQSPEYFNVTMQAYKSGERANDLYNRMRLISQSLSDEEINALADYYSAMGQ